MQTGFSVMDAMTTQPIVVKPTQTLAACARLMKKHDVSSLLVTEKEKLLGLITETDIVHSAVAAGKDPQKVIITDCMKKKMPTITPDRDIYDALVVMRDKEVRHLPVTLAGQVRGMLTLKDILKIEPDLFDIVHEKWAIREAERKPIFGELPADYFR